MPSDNGPRSRADFLTEEFYSGLWYSEGQHNQRNVVHFQSKS